MGYSEENREIPVLSLGSGRRKLLFAGAIHGREYVSTAYLMECVQIYAAWAVGKEECLLADVPKVFEEFCFHIIPMCNPDSVMIAQSKALPRVIPKDFEPCMYKNNTDNINLNADFPFEWDSVPTWRHSGKVPASAKETRFLMSLCESNFYEKMLSFHSRGDCIYWRDTTNKEIPCDEAVAEALHRVCGFEVCPVSADIETYSAGFENWFRFRFAGCGVCVELVGDEKVTFEDMCKGFERYTRWEQTKYAFLAGAGVI